MGEFVDEGVNTAVGVPEITPVDESSTNPVGRVPAVSAYVTAPLKLAETSDGVGVMAVFRIPATF